MKKLMLSLAMTMGLFVANSQVVYTSDVWRSMYNHISLFDVWASPKRATITVNEEESTLSTKNASSILITIDIYAMIDHTTGNSPKGYPYESYYYLGVDTRGYNYTVSITYIDGRTFVCTEIGGMRNSFLLNEKAKIAFPKAINYASR